MQTAVRLFQRGERVDALRWRRQNKHSKRLFHAAFPGSTSGELRMHRAQFREHGSEHFPPRVVCFLVALPPERDLLIRAKHLFVEAIAWRPSSLGEDGRFDVAVTFDERRGYIGTAPELRQPVAALSLGGLRRHTSGQPSPSTWPCRSASPCGGEGPWRSPP